MTNYQRQNGVDTRIARIFNTYGPRMSEVDGRVVSNFAVQALRGKPLTVYGDGSQTRSFCFVSDMVAGLEQLMDADWVPGPVNLGSPQECSILSLAKLILELTGSKSEIQFGVIPVDDPVRRRPDIGRAVRHLDWEPFVDLKEGLRRTIEYYEEILARNPSG